MFYILIRNLGGFHFVEYLQNEKEYQQQHTYLHFMLWNVWTSVSIVGWQTCCCWVTFCVVLCLHNSIICFLLLMKIESTIAEPTSPSVYIIGLDVLKFLQHGMLIIFLFVVFWFLMGCTLTSFVMIFYFYFLGFLDLIFS